MSVRMYSTVRDVRDEVGVQSAANTTDDAKMYEAIQQASARLDAETGHVGFWPQIATRYMDATGNHVNDNGRVLHLPHGWALLSITSLSDGGGTARVEGTDYNADPRGRTPVLKLRTLSTSALLWNYYSSDAQDAISITGNWGWHSDYTNAWVSTGDTVRNDPLSDSATSLTVSDASAADAYGRRPRFSPGQLLKVESEYLAVRAVDTNTNTVTVLRGVQGSTAASHAQDTAISVYEVEPVIHRLCTRLAAFLYARRGAFEASKFDGVATVNWPDDMPGEIGSALNAAGLLAAARRPI